MDIGFIGVGNMGFGMANNILKAGHKLVVSDLRRDAAAPLLEDGATWAETAQEVAAQSEVTFTSLPGPPDVEAVVMADNGVLAGLSPGDVYIDLSTNSPTVVRAVHAELLVHRRPVVGEPLDEALLGAIPPGGVDEGEPAALHLVDVDDLDDARVGDRARGAVRRPQEPPSSQAPVFRDRRRGAPARARARGGGNESLPGGR